MSKSFVLNDGKKINSHGFRVRNSGIDTTRFNANPVMLDEHWAFNRYVLGKWNHVEKNGDVLTATPEFDEADENAKVISGKVERGYIKGASIGILFKSEDMQMQPDGVYELIKCELMEASICAIPSNANAIRLYANEGGQPLSTEQIKLSMQSVSVINPKENKTMNKIILSVAALVALGLDKTAGNPAEGVDGSVLNEAIAGLQSKLNASEQKLIASELALKTLRDAAAEQKKLAAEKIVDDAIAAGKIDATAKADWLKLATNNETLATSTLSALPAKQSLAGQLNNPAAGTAGEIKTMDDFQKLSVAQQLAFRKEQPEAFATLIAGM